MSCAGARAARDCRYGREGSNHWLGRTCKVSALMGSEWKLVAQTGALRYAVPART
jgi:hypothetical protein